MHSSHIAEIQRGDRFEFGENWKRFLSTLDEARIKEAEDSLRKMLDVDDLRWSYFSGCRFRERHLQFGGQKAWGSRPFI